MKEYSVEEIIKGLKKRNNLVLKYLYKELYPIVSNFITTNSGQEDDAKDIFQEALIILFRKINNPDFNLPTQFKPYILSMCKNLWLYKLRSLKHPVEIDDSVLQLSSKEELPDENYGEKLKISLLQKNFIKLDWVCRKIIQLFFDGNSHQQIAKNLKISEDKSRKKKQYCLDKLIGFITSDPDYKKHYAP